MCAFQTETFLQCIRLFKDIFSVRVFDLIVNLENGK